MQTAYLTIFCTVCTWSHTYHYFYLTLDSLVVVATWLMFSIHTITCCYLLSFACYYLLTLESLVVVVTWLMFSFNTITCCYLLSFVCYYLLTLYSLVVVATVLLHNILNKGLPEYQICRRSENFKHKPKQANFDVKKCTLIFLKSGGAEADFVVGWTIKVSIQGNVLLSNFENREE